MKEINLEDFNHKISLAVRFMDIDALNHVNNARYLNYLEEGRINYVREVLNTYHSVQDMNVLVARVEIDYIAPILFGSEVNIYTRVKKIGNSSFLFETAICAFYQQKETLSAKSLVTLVNFDPKTQKSSPIQDEIRQKIKEFEKNLD